MNSYKLNSYEFLCVQGSINKLLSPHLCWSLTTCSSDLDSEIQPLWLLPKKKTEKPMYSNGNKQAYKTKVNSKY